MYFLSLKEKNFSKTLPKAGLARLVAEEISVSSDNFEPFKKKLKSKYYKVVQAIVKIFIVGH